MSSAKTIAAILSLVELVDLKSFIGNPFTSQPIYIVACAFLMEAAAQSTPLSDTPVDGHERREINNKQATSRQTSTAKHTLLSSVAIQNYQRCYNALKFLETYWAGTRYIVTTLDRRAKGIMGPLLTTPEDTTISAMKQDVTTPGRRRSTSHNASIGTTEATEKSPRSRAGDGSKSAWPPNIEPSEGMSSIQPLIFCLVSFGCS